MKLKICQAIFFIKKTEGAELTVLNFFFVCYSVHLFLPSKGQNIFLAVALTNIQQGASEGQKVGWDLNVACGCENKVG